MRAWNSPGLRRDPYRSKRVSLLYGPARLPKLRRQRPGPTLERPPKRPCVASSYHASSGTFSMKARSSVWLPRWRVSPHPAGALNRGKPALRRPQPPYRQPTRNCAACNTPPPAPKRNIEVRDAPQSTAARGRGFVGSVHRATLRRAIRDGDAPAHRSS